MVQKNARISYKELAALTGVAPSTCKKISRSITILAEYCSTSGDDHYGGEE
jgi:hypothetical protein